MINEKQIEYLNKLLYECRDLAGSESRLMKNGDDTYGIEFEGYQTLKVTIKPLFDMSDTEVDALMNLFAHGLPILKELLQECERLDYMRQSLLEAIRIIAIAGDDDMRKIKNITVERESDEEELTIGDK